MHRPRPRPLRLAGLFAAGTLLGAAAGGADDGKQAKNAPGPAPGALDPALGKSVDRRAAEEALERGLAFLAGQQALSRDGSFPGGQQGATVGITSLAALAFMSAGNTPGRGPYGAEVAKAVDYLLSRIKPEGDPEVGYIADEADKHSRMHGHGFATLALTQAYSMSPSSRRGGRTAAAIRAAIRRIEVAQGAEGGWDYDALRGLSHEGSITVCLVQALRAARNSGFFVDKKVIARAIDYVKRLQTEEGSFRYRLNDKKVSVALTAACLSTLHATGIYDGREVDDGYGYVWRELAVRDVAVERGGPRFLPDFPYYERYYLAQALWQHKDETIFGTWERTETQRVITKQNADGSWSDTRYGPSYGTAMNCLYLALPDEWLPIFQR